MTETWADEDDVARHLFEDAQHGEHSEHSEAADELAFEREARLLARAWAIAIREGAKEIVEGAEALLREA